MKHIKLLIAAILVAITVTSASAQSPVPATSGSMVQVITTGSNENVSAVKVALAHQLNANATQQVRFYNQLKAFTATPTYAALDSATQAQIQASLTAIKTAINAVAPNTIP